jgi:outer membrane protein assembly factor BamB
VAVTVGADGVVAAYEVADGRERWRHALGESTAGPPAFGDGVVFVPGRRALYAFRLGDGGLAWKNDADGNVLGVAVAGGYPVVACEDGKVLLGGETGFTELTVLPKGGAFSPGADGGSIYVGDLEKRLNCFDLRP